jgi:LacI family transcriptional regulator
MKRVSMQDIATELGLSITTVSFVLNGKSTAMGISESTVKKVNDLILKKGYNPNSAARVLRTGKSNTLALIVEDIGNHFFGNIAKIIELEAYKNGYKVFFSSTEGDNIIAKGLIAAMQQSAVDGFIITATSGIDEEIIKLKKEKKPFILIDRLLPEIDTDYVGVDNFFGAYELTNHLLENGYSKIGFVSITSDMTQMIDRKKGYEKALKNKKVPIDNKLILEIEFSEDNKLIIASIQKYLKENKYIDAVFFSTNYLGLLGIEAIQLNKLKIGKDIGVVSFDDHDVFRLMTPSITVASQPITEIASRAIELLLKKLGKGKKQSHTVIDIIKPDIIIRNSSPQKK